MTSLLLCLALTCSADNRLTQVRELGPVKVATTLTPRAPIIGDEITLEIRVEAAAGVEVLMPEFGEALSRYTIVDFVPRQQVAGDGSAIHTQRYTLQPYLSGAQAIPPILIEFVDHRPGQKPAPDDQEAYELLTERLEFTVQSVLPENASAQLHPPLGELTLIATSSGARWGSLAGGLLLVGGALALLWVYARRQRRRVRRRNAYEIARARLDALLARDPPRDEAAIAAFFVDISAIVRRYLEDRFEVRAPELTTEEFLTVTGESGVLSREHQGLLRDFLKQADLVKFAGVRAGEVEIAASIESAACFLEETRENAPWIDVPAVPESQAMVVATPVVTTSSQSPDAR